MKKEFIPYEQALTLKELGFDKPCFAIYNLGLSEFETANIGQIRLFSSIFRIDDKQSNISYVNDKNSSKVSAPLYQQAFDWLITKCEKIYEQEMSLKFWNDGSGCCKLMNLDDDLFDYNSKIECLEKLIEIIKNK